MSISKLSTELDNRITTFLIGDPPALNALSKVSRYYHGIAEPRLYTHVVLKEGDFIGLMQLCYAIITRGNLALQIRGFSLMLSSDLFLLMAPVAGIMFNMPCAGVVKGAVDKYFGEDATSEHSAQDQPDSPMPTGLHPDRILAFILCAAKNIESMTLECVVWERGNRAVEQALTQQWMAGGFFRHLQSLVLGYWSSWCSHPLPQSITSFEFQDQVCRFARMHVNIPGVITASHPLALPATLSTLVFTSVGNVTPNFVGSVVRFCQLGSLEELRVHGCGKFGDRLTREDFIRLSNLLAECAPKLSSLRWTGQQVERLGVAAQWDDFKVVTKLRKLQLDLDMIASPFVDMLLEPQHVCNLGALSNPTAMFPDSLEDLTLDGVEIDRFRNLVGELLDSIESVEGFDNALRVAVVHLASKFPSLKRLALSFDLTAYIEHLHEVPPILDQGDVSLLRLAADELFKIGFRLEIFFKSKFAESALKVFMKHGSEPPVIEAQ